MTKKPKEKENEKLMFAFLATFLSIVGFAIALIAKRDDKYVMFYAKQSFVVFVFGLCAGIIAQVFSILPIIGGIIYFALAFLVFVVWLLSWIFALSGNMKSIPVLGEYAKKLVFNSKIY